MTIYYFIVYMIINTNFKNKIKLCGEIIEGNFEIGKLKFNKNDRF